MPSYGNAYAATGAIDPSDVKAHQVKNMKTQFYQAHYPCNASYWQQGVIDIRFIAGDQSLWSMIYGDNNYYQARRFFFNLLKRVRNMISGFQRRNRKSTITVPMQTDTDDLCDDFNKVLRWCEDRDGFQEILSGSFEGALAIGSDWLHLYPNYLTDPVSGDMMTDNVSTFNILVDSWFRKQDLSDCNGVWRRRWVSKKMAQALLPMHSKEISKMDPRGLKDGKFPVQAELLNLNTSQLFYMDEFYYRDTREATMIIDPKSGESTEWEEEEGEDEDTLNQVLRQMPWLLVKKMQIPTVKMSIALGDREMYNGPTLLGTDSYPFIPTFCYYEPDLQSYSWRLQGIVRNARDAQYLYNMRKVIELDILQSQINSGWIYKIDRVVDPKAFRQSGQGFLVPLKAGDAPISDSVQRIEAPNVPASMIELSKILGEEVNRIIGANEELLGSATDDKAGILSMLRQGAGLTTLQPIFDRLDYTQRLFGKLRLEAIRKNFTKGKVRNILGHEPDPRFFKSGSLKYSIAVEEGNYSTTQRQMELQQLLHFREIGMPISDRAIMNAAFITNKKQLMAELDQNAQQQQQQQQQQAQIEQAKQQSEMMLEQAKSRTEEARQIELIASAKEKEAKVDEDLSTAEAKRIEAEMNLVKLMIDLEDSDLKSFGNAFNIAQMMKNSNNPNQQSTMEENNGKGRRTQQTAKKRVGKVRG